MLPLNSICAGTLRALRLMMDDVTQSADMAQLAASFSGLTSGDQLTVQLAPMKPEHPAVHPHSPQNTGAGGRRRSGSAGAPPSLHIANGDLAPP